MSALVQNTEEWLTFRKTKIGASDAPIIMEVSPWKTPYKLWLEKLDIEQPPEMNAAMQRGHDAEETARMLFTFETGIQVKPEVMMHRSNEWMMASFDGLSSDKRTAVEIKCPGKVDHAKAKAGEIPEKYFPQLQHQIEVCGLDMVYYYSYNEEESFLIEVNRDDKYIKKMVEKEKEFWECMQNFTAPKMTLNDYERKNDDIWIQASSEWRLASAKLKEYEKREKDLRETIIGLSQKRPSIGGGIRLSKVVRKGTVDYSKIPELKKIDLNLYRKESQEYWKLSEENEL